MRRYDRSKRVMQGITAMLMAGLLAGCGGSTGDLAVIPNNSYEKAIHTETQVYKGALSADFSMKLKAEGYSRENYAMQEPSLEIDQVYVSVGDRVAEGDLLISFKSEELQKRLDARIEDKEQKELLLQHYRKLMQADSKQNYKTDIEALEMDLEVDELYIGEYEQLLEEYQVRARGNGTIVSVSDSARSGIYVKGETMIAQACGTGNYTGETKELYEFAPGQEFSAFCGVAEYRVRVSDVQTQTNEEGVITSSVTFEPISDMSAVAENEQLKVVVHQDIAEEVVYVEAKAIRRIGDRSYVLTLDENGYTSIVWIKTGEELGDYVVISEGLSGGERVVLR